MPSLLIPYPGDALALLWVGMGIAFGRGLGKKLDQEIITSEWFKKLTGSNPVLAGLVRRLLDCTHHWWIGMILWVYAGRTIPYLGIVLGPKKEIFWFGVGLFVDDIRDYRHVMSRYSKAIGEEDGDDGGDEDPPE